MFGAECLDRGLRRPRQQVGSVGQVEGFAVPVEDRRVRRQAADDRVAGVADPDRPEADLGRRPGADLGAERGGDQLRAEADAEDRLVRLDRRRQPLRSAASPGWASVSPTPIGPPMNTAPATSGGAGSASPSSGRAVMIGIPSNAASIRCGPSQGTCWTTSNGPAGGLTLPGPG